jgi:hypothetical protein
VTQSVMVGSPIAVCAGAGPTRRGQAGGYARRPV